MNQPETSLTPPQSPFYGTDFLPPIGGKRSCNLLMLADPHVNHTSDFLKIAGFIREIAPKIRCTVIENRPQRVAAFLASALRPTLAVSLVPLANFRPLRGCLVTGRNLSKSEEYAALEKAGIAVAKWQLIKPDEDPDLSGYGPYVVTKPNRGMRGALVKIKKKERVRARSSEKKEPETPETTRDKYGPRVSEGGEMLAQQFIYTGEWPINYRVATLFGKVLHSEKSEASRERKKLSGPAAFNECGVSSIVASGKGCVKVLNYDEEIIRFGEAAAVAFPNIPLLGFDIVREVPSGKLYVLEANAVGYVWQFSSPMGQNMQRDNNIHFESQFDGLRRAAHILAAKTQELAR